MPTIKQKRAFTKVAENGGVVSTAMIEVGFSPQTAKTPQKLTESKGWKELMDKYMPDDKLAEKHEQLLEDEKSEIQVKALDMAYKLKGSYAPERSLNLNLTADMRNISPQARKLKEEYEKKLLETIQDEH